MTEPIAPETVTSVLDSFTNEDLRHALAYVAGADPELFKEATKSAVRVRREWKNRGEIPADATHYDSLKRIVRNWW